MIYKYNLVAPVVDKKKPYIDDKGYLIIPNIKRNYRYYIEGSVYNRQIGTNEYFLLLGVSKFDEQTRKCRVDDYCRLKVLLHGKMKDFAMSEFKDNGNIEIEYVESEENYDVYLIK